MTPSPSWIGLLNSKPISPLTVLSNVLVNSTEGTFEYSTDYLATSWGTSPLSLSSNPTCTSLGSDNLASVANAAQWNFQHQTANLSSTVAPPLRKVVFARVGSSWQMNFPFATSAVITDLQISLRSNSATRGDSQGTIPAISFRGIGIAIGNFTLSMTFNSPGTIVLGIWTKAGATISMFELEVVAVQDSAPAQASPLKLRSLTPTKGSGTNPNVIIGPPKSMWSAPTDSGDCCDDGSDDCGSVPIIMCWPLPPGQPPY